MEEEKPPRRRRKQEEEKEEDKHKDEKTSISLSSCFLQPEVNLLTLLWSLAAPSWTVTFPELGDRTTGPAERLSLALSDWTSCGAASACWTVLGLLLICSAPIMLLRGSAGAIHAGTREESESTSALLAKFVLQNKKFDSGLSLVSLLWLKQKQN